MSLQTTTGSHSLFGQVEDKSEPRRRRAKTSCPSSEEPNLLEDFHLYLSQNIQKYVSNKHIVP